MSNDHKQQRRQAIALLAQLESEDDAEFDSACAGLRDYLPAVRPYLLRAMLRAQHPKVRGALLELMGNTKAPEFVPYVAKQLESNDVRDRFSAFVALQDIGSCEARRILSDIDLKKIRRRSRDGATS